MPDVTRDMTPGVTPNITPDMTPDMAPDMTPGIDRDGGDCEDWYRAEPRATRIET